VGRLADESGVAITSIYEYFPTVDAVIGAVLQQVRQQLIDQHHALPDNTAATLFDFLLSSVQRAVRIRRALTELHREIYTRHIAEFDVPAPLIETEDDFLNSATSFRTSFTRFRQDIRLHDLGEAAFLVVRLLQVATRTAVVERQTIDAEPALEWRIAWSLYQLLTCAPPDHLSAQPPPH
jgi:AcrR family transcriptional regulator